MVRPAYGASAAAAAMLAVVLWDALPHGILLAWLGATLAVVLVRSVLHWRYARAAEPADARAWERRFALGALASGLAWACAPALLVPYGNSLLEAGVIIIVGGVLVAGAGLNAASLRAVYALATPPLAVLAAQLARQADPVHRLLALTLVLFAVVMARMVHEMHGSIVRGLSEQLHNRGLREQVQASEARLRDAMESLAEGIAVWDAQDRLVVCNDAYASLYGGGRRPAELAGTPFERVAANAWDYEQPASRLPAPRRAEWIERRRTVHRQADGTSLQYQVRDGRWLQAKTVRMPAGGSVELVSDITELRSAQDAFLGVLAEEDLVLDTLPVGVAFIQNHTVVRCNRRLEQILGYAAGELNGASTRVWFASDERWLQASEAARRLLLGGGIMEGDARLVRRDGSRVWCRVLGRALRPDAPDASEILTFADIDQRVAAERALKESEEKLRLAVEAAGIMYWEWDRRRDEVTWGDGHARDWPSYREQVHPDDRERYLAAVSAAWEKGEPYSCEYRVVGRGGQVAWILARGKTMLDASGRVHRMIGVAQDVTERRAQEDRARFLADHDSLTGLPNRRLLDDRLRQAVFQAERRGAKVAAIVVDLDEFKQVNDSAGHGAGDAVLREAALRLAGCVRKADTLARQGGDEFVIVIADVQTETDGRIVAEKILRALEEPFEVQDRSFRLSASIGVSIYPLDAADGEALLRNADSAMYRAKALGRNRYRFYGE